MAEYIEKETLMKRLNDFNEWCKDGRLQGTVFAIDVIKDIPAADVQPVKRGRWEYIRNVKLSGTIKLCECSICHNKIFGGLSYCGNCGARMDLKDGDTNG